MLDEKRIGISEDQNIIFQRREAGLDQDLLNKTWLEAARNSDLEKLQETFDRGAHPFAKDEDENTVLHLACLSKAPLKTMEKLALLLSKKKSLHDVAEKTPLQKLFSELNRNGDSVLHLASTHAELIELLFLEGIEIDARNNNGETPLHLASKSKQKESIITLIQASADVYANNFNQETPLDYAQDVSLKKAMVQEIDAYLPIRFNRELNFDEKKATVPSLRELTAKAAQGDAEAQYQLGVIYYRDHMKWSVLSDEKKAVKYWKQSAELNHPASSYEYAVYLTRSTGGVPTDTKRASFYADKAVEGGWRDALKEKAGNGDPTAQYHLGRCCGYGLLVPKDEKEAVRWYRLAADQGYALAQNNLGVMYANGLGVAKDEKEAVRWYRLSAEQGNARAKNKLKELLPASKDLGIFAKMFGSFFRAETDVELNEEKKSVNLKYT